MKTKTLETPSNSNPCVSCGACCSYFRVEFYWREAEKDSEHKVPKKLTEDLNSFKRCMKGTLYKNGNRCTALAGKVGKSVECTIYSNRPSPCRNFQYSYADGKPNKRCDEARAAHGLKPLTRPEIIPSEKPLQSPSTPEIYKNENPSHLPKTQVNPLGKTIEAKTTGPG